MKFAFICDTFFRKKVANCLVNGEVPNHDIITITASEYLQSGELPEGIAGVIIEKGTWQKSFSMFRYFRLLPQLETQKIAFVASSHDTELKGRAGMKGKEFIIPNNIVAEDASAQLTRLTELPLPAFTHPKSKAVA
ncbi:MAG: hypothetical protein LBC85_06940 [Fibromonadaceae bacterium]|jgi:hypothetical protein|nr:hypothetical protein [Fibromonadaceae bacterium]